MSENQPTINTAPSGVGIGTGTHRHGDFLSAYRSVSGDDKKNALTMLAAAGVTLAVVFLSRLLWLFEPVLDLIYYATLSEIIYYILLGVGFTVYVIFLNRFLKRRCGVRIFAIDKRDTPVWRLLAIIAIGAVAVFITSAAFKFKIKIQIEMGTGVTMATALTNIAVYFYYGFHLWLALVAAVLTQRAMSILVPAKYTLPWGALVIVLVFGVPELILELCTTPHVYPWLYYIFTYAYAAIFILSEHRFHTTFWAMIVIMVL